MGARMGICWDQAVGRILRDNARASLLVAPDTPSALHSSAMICGFAQVLSTGSSYLFPLRSVYMGTCILMCDNSTSCRTLCEGIRLPDHKS